MNTEARFPSIHASAAFTDSAVVHANHVGVNPIELDALSQVISRLSRDESTVAPSSMERELRELEELGYIETQPPRPGPWWSLRALRGNCFRPTSGRYGSRDTCSAAR